MEPEAHFLIAEAEADEPQVLAAHRPRFGRLTMDSAWWGTFGLLLIAMSLTLTGELLLKSGINRHGGLDLSMSALWPTVVKLFTNFFILGGFMFVFGGALVWLVVLSKWDLSLAYPLLSINYILALILSALLLGEKVSGLQALGALVIIGGVTLVSIGHEGMK